MIDYTNANISLYKGAKSGTVATQLKFNNSNVAITDVTEDGSNKFYENASTDAAYDVSTDFGKTAVLSGNTFFYYDTGLTSTNTVSGWCKVEPAS